MGMLSGMGRVRGQFAILALGALCCQPTLAAAPAPGVTIATADINGDGIPDLVTLVPGNSEVDVVTVDAQGSFTLVSPQIFPDISQMSSLALADVNNDGIADVIVSDASSSSTGVRVLLNDGDGNLAADVSYPTESSAGAGPVSVILADVNGDGWVDIITANGRDGSISVLLNNGDGTFAAPVSYLAGTDPVAAAVADMNGDGFPDLVVVDSAGDAVQVLLNDGDSTFAAALPQSVGAGPVSVILSDIDGDGRQDVVVVDQDENTAGVLLGHGDGSFDAPLFYKTGAEPGWVTAQDLNGDGKPDLVTANYSDGSVSVFTNSGGGSFVAGQTLFPAYGSYDTMVMTVGGTQQVVSTNVPAGAVVLTPGANVTQSGGNAPKSTVHRISGVHDPQTSNGSGALDGLSLLLLSLLWFCRQPLRNPA